jgi:pimeloyl-ACP methyl ester carboxylesterase
LSLKQLFDFQQRYPEIHVMVDGAPWRYRSAWADAPSLILLPGVHGTADLFYKVGLLLGRRLNIVTVTYPPWADCDRLAAGLGGFMDAVGLHRTSVCGAFLGGYIAQKFVHRQPERVETLFLANSFYDPAALKMALPKADRFAAQPAVSVVESHLDWLLSILGSDPAQTDLKQALRLLLGDSKSAHLLKTRLLALLLSKPVERVPISKDEVVLLDSDKDLLVPQATRVAMRARYASSEQHHFEGAGHHLAMLRPEKFAEILEGRLVG